VPRLKQVTVASALLTLKGFLRISLMRPQKVLYGYDLLGLCTKTERRFAQKISAYGRAMLIASAVGA
jgi:hypothetical protein